MSLSLYFLVKKEQGQRGLGFRSLLGNPVQKDILEKLTQLKKENGIDHLHVQF